MDGRLYVGVDSTQYSNGLFKEGNTKELCVAVFSTNPESLIPGNCMKKRNLSVLENLLENRNSVSITIDPEKVSDNVRPLIYSAGRFISFYMEEVFKEAIKKLEIHIDGSLYGREKKYLKDLLGCHGIVLAEGYKKFFKKNRYRKRKDKKTTYCTQPSIILAADSLSNYLFRKKGILLFPNLDSRETRIINLQLFGKSVEHIHLSA